MIPEIFRVDLVFSQNTPAENHQNGEKSNETEGNKTLSENTKANITVVLYRRENFEKLRKEIEDLILAKNPLVTLPGSIKTSEEWAKQFSQILLRIGELQNKDNIKAKEDQLRVFLGIQNAETDRNRNRLQSDDNGILFRSSDQSQDLMGERNRND